MARAILANREMIIFDEATSNIDVESEESIWEAIYELAKEAGAQYRKTFGESNSYILDSLRGLKEILLFSNGQKRLDKMNEHSHELNKNLSKIKSHEGIIRGLTDLIIMIAILSFVGLGFSLFTHGEISFIEIIVAVVILASSFGPVVALSNLSNNLLHTFACAERIFALLDEKPYVKEVSGEDYSAYFS